MTWFNVKLTFRFETSENGAMGSLQVSFTPASHEDCLVQIRIDLPSHLVGQGRMNVDLSTMCYGYDLERFADALEKLHSHYKGSALFSNQLQDLEIELKLADQARGRVEVSLRHQHFISAGDSSVPHTSNLDAGGFLTDQSFLMGYTRDIRAFLKENGISTKHPHMP